jgi:hypothetical protein
MPFSPSISPGVSFPKDANLSNTGGGFMTQGVVVSEYDTNPFAILNKVYQRHENRPGDFRLLLKAWGASRGVDAPQTGHYEQSWWDNTVGLQEPADIGGLGAGDPIEVQLTSGSMYDLGATVNGSSQKASYIRKNDVLILDGGKQARVTEVDTTTNPHTITLTPVKAAVDITAAVTDGNQYMIAYNSWAEGDGLPAGVFTRIYKYTNDFTIVKEGHNSTGSNLTTRLFVSFNQTSNGNLYVELNPQVQVRFERRCNGALLWGQQADNLTDFVSNTGVDSAVMQTEGFLEFIGNDGNTATYSPGSLAASDFYTIGRRIEQERAGTHDYLNAMGYELYAELEQLLTTNLQSDLTPFLMKRLGEAMGVPGDDIQPFLNSDFDFYTGFKSYRVGGYNYYFKLLHDFNEGNAAAVMNGSTYTYDYIKWGVLFPMGQTTDRRTNKPVFMMGYEYRQLDGYSREMVIGDYAGVGVAGAGGFRPTPVGPYDSISGGMVSEIAFHGGCPNLSFLLTPA